MELEQMRKIGNPKDGNWKKLEEDARFNLSNALGVDTDSVEAYTVFGLVYMEGWQTNKNRLDLAKTAPRRGQEAQREVPGAAERVRPVLDAQGLAEPGAAVVPGGGRRRPEVRRGAHQRGP